MATIEDVAKGLVGRRRSCCNIGIGQALNGAVLKPSCRASKDEVGSATDVAVFEVEARAGHPRVNGVLMSDESAMDENQTVTYKYRRY